MPAARSAVVANLSGSETGEPQLRSRGIELVTMSFLLGMTEATPVVKVRRNRDNERYTSVPRRSRSVIAILSGPGDP
jgi:hypothetical protein